MTFFYVCVAKLYDLYVLYNSTSCLFDLTDAYAYALQAHIRVLEASQESIASLLMGLEYLINISYVDDTEVFKVSSVKFLHS